MDQTHLETMLADLSLGAVRYFDQVGSTNDEAAQWAAQAAPDLSLVIADEQTDGRGRAGRHWITPRGTALAFSIILYPTLEESRNISRMTALGALAVCAPLKNRYHLPAKIKWPNDVLLDDKKVAGVLVETQWTGEQPGAVILGLGINVAPASVAFARKRESVLHYPSTCVQSVLGSTVDRLELLHTVCADILHWRSRLNSPDFLQTWEANLAYRNEWVQVIPTKITQSLKNETAPLPIQEGQVIGLSNDGSLKLRTRLGKIIALEFGEVHLRPARETTAEEETYVR
jgi:BirA family biotin operon repressor/biotin-[acetyl-CoA-carboxylase] ligase